MSTGHITHTDSEQPTAPVRSVYTIAEAAEILGFAAPTLYERLRNGTLNLKAVRLGRGMRVTKASVDAVLSGDAPLQKLA